MSTIVTRSVKGYPLTWDEMDDNLNNLNYGSYISVKDTAYGAVGDGITDDTAAIQAAITANPGKVIYIPPGDYFVSSTITIRTSKTNIMGSGQGSTTIKRSGDYGDTFFFTGNDSTGFIPLDVGISRLSIESSGLTTSGAHIRFRGCSRIDVFSIFLQQGFIGFKLEGCTAATFSNLYLVFTNLYGGSATGRKYLFLGNAPAPYAHPSCGDVFISNFNFRGNVTYQVTEIGIDIVSSDGIWFSNGHVGNSTYANISINANTTEMMNLLFFDNVMSDEGTLYSLLIAGSGPTVNRHIQFSNCLFKSGGIPAYCQYGITFAAACTVQHVSFSNCTITEMGATGVNIDSQFANYITFSNCDVTWNGRNTPNTYPGYKLANGVKHVSIIGGRSGGYPSTFTVSQSYGIETGTGHSYNSFSNMSLIENSLGSINGNNAECVTSNIRSQDSINISSAATITVPSPLDFVIVTGTTNVSTITSSWLGRIMTLSFNNVLTVQDGVGNLKLNGDFITSDEDTLTLAYNGANWIEVTRSPN